MSNNHNKKRNTGFLMRVLLREVAEATIDKNQNRKKKVRSIIKKYFKPGTPMAKDLDLYNSLLESHDLSEKSAERLLNEVKTTASKINKKKLFNQQTKLINEINKELSQDVFNNFLKDYRNLATIYQILNPDRVSTRKKVKLEEDLIKKLQIEKEEVIKEELETADALVYKTFVNKFNERYGNSLLNEQRKIIKYFLLEGQDSVELKIFVNDEIKRLKKKMNEALKTREFKADEEMQEKGKKVIALLEDYKNKKLDNEGLTRILEIQDVVSEIFEGKEDVNKN